MLDTLNKGEYRRRYQGTNSQEATGFENWPDQYRDLFCPREKVEKKEQKEALIIDITTLYEREGCKNAENNWRAKILAKYNYLRPNMLAWWRKKIFLAEDE